MTDLIDGLERLKALKEGGHLSETEFQSAKARLLQAASNHAADNAPIAEASSEKVAEAQAYDDDEYSSPSIWPKVAAGAALFAAMGGGAYWLVKPRSSDAQTAVVQDENLNCRVGASLDASVKEMLPHGTQITIKKRENGWALIAEKDCWISESRIHTEDQPDSASTTSEQSIEPDAEELIPAKYDLTTNPNPQAIKLAQRLLNSGYQCVLGPTREIGQTYAILDTKALDLKYVTKALSGDLLDAHESAVHVNGLSFDLKGEDDGELRDNTMRIVKVDKADNGDILMFADIVRGGWSGTSLWWMRCGDQTMGSANWWSNFTRSNEMLNLAYD